MPNFRYRALTQNGEIVNGTLTAPTSAEVARRIEYLKLLPIERFRILLVCDEEVCDFSSCVTWVSSAVTVVADALAASSAASFANACASVVAV